MSGGDDPGASTERRVSALRIGHTQVAELGHLHLRSFRFSFSILR